jgi:pimeloyl-ACP methyl ester carboxylesterase
VSLARRLAAQGFPCLRFDRPGIGDSAVAAPGVENDVYAKDGVERLRQAMSYLRDAHGHERIILIGLCSGAYFSFHAAVADPRVVAAVLINPLTFHWNEGDSLEVRTRKTYKSTDFYLRAALKRETWLRGLKGRVNVRGILLTLGQRVLARARAVVSQKIAQALRRGVPLSDIAQAFKALAARGTAMFMIFGAEDGGIDIMEEHLGPGGQLMRGSDHFRLEIVNGADHTFTPLWSQDYLGDLIADHLGPRFL